MEIIGPVSCQNLQIVYQIFNQSSKTSLDFFFGMAYCILWRLGSRIFMLLGSLPLFSWLYRPRFIGFSNQVDAIHVIPAYFPVILKFPKMFRKHGFDFRTCFCIYFICTKSPVDRIDTQICHLHGQDMSDDTKNGDGTI